MIHQLFWFLNDDHRGLNQKFGYAALDFNMQLLFKVLFFIVGISFYLFISTQIDEALGEPQNGVADPRREANLNVIENELVAGFEGVVVAPVIEWPRNDAPPLPGNGGGA